VIPSRIQQIALPPFDPLNQRAAELRRQGHHVISLGQALPFFAPPEAALASARAALEGPDVHRYSTDPGLLSLRQALAERLEESAPGVDPSELVITAGANHAFSLAITTLAGSGDEIVLPAPYFTNHHMAIAALGAIPVEAPVADRDTFAVRWPDIEKHLTPRTRVVVLCTPSNPTGAAIDPGEGDRIVNELMRRDIAVICDETYRPFVYEGEAWSAASVRGWRQNVVVVGSFSKAFGMMGWRVGFLLASAAICEQVIKVQDAVIICAPVISQMAVEGAVRHAWSHAASFHHAMRRRRAIMSDGIAGIPRLTWTPPQAGLFAFTRVDGCRASAALSHDLLEQAHVVTLPGSAFGTCGEGHLRLSYGYADESDLREALTRMAEHFAHYPS
jgi:aminotransferase